MTMTTTTTMMKTITRRTIGVREVATEDQGRKTATGEAVTTREMVGMTTEEKAEEVDKTTTEVAIAGAGSSPLKTRPPGGGLRAQRAVFLNGMLHGFSWDGAPSLAPALACTTWRGVLWFLVAYCSGTMLAMSATTAIIGEGTSRVSEALDAPDIPKKLSIVSSFIAIAIGALWMVKAIFL